MSVTPIILPTTDKRRRKLSQDIQNNKNNKLCEHLNKITDTLFMYTFPFLTYVLHYNTMQSDGWL